MSRKFVDGQRLVVRVGGVTHEVIRFERALASVVFACNPRCVVLLPPDTSMLKYGEDDIDCMTCLVRRAKA